MSVYKKDDDFINALKKLPQHRTKQDICVIFSRLHQFETLSSMREQSLRSLCSVVRYEFHDSNKTLYMKEDPTRCWYILLSGSVFIQGSMFLPHASFGKAVPGTRRRGCQCLVLEPSEMIAIDYPDIAMRSHLRPQNNTSRTTLDTTEMESKENSPSHGRNRRQIGNGHIMTSQSQTSLDSNRSSQSYSQQTQDGDDEMEDASSDLDEEHEDSISLHSESSLVIRDLVTEVLKKEVQEREPDDHDTLLEFTKSLQAFANMTEPIRRALCKVMLYAWVEKNGTVVLRDKEPLDSWSVIINGQVQVKQNDGSEEILSIGDSFGVSASLDTQYHKGEMVTLTNDCQFLCIAQTEYFEVLTRGEENRDVIKDEEGNICMVKEKRELEGGGGNGQSKSGNIVIQGTASSLLRQLLEESAIDTTYAEDYLLTYRSFHKEPLVICNKLLDWFDDPKFQDKVTRVILLWVNNHFNDFEDDRRMMELLERFEEKLKRLKKTGQSKLFNIACATKAKSRIVNLKRASNEEKLYFEILGGSHGYAIFISSVTDNSDADKKGIKRGDQLLNVNGQNFEKLSLESAKAILRKNTDLTLNIKTNLFAFKEMLNNLENPVKDKKRRSHQSDSATLHSLVESKSFDVSESKHKKGLVGVNFSLRKVNTSIGRLSVPSVLLYRRSPIDELSTLPPKAQDDSNMSRLKVGSFATIDGMRQITQATSNPDLVDQALFNEQDSSLPTEVPEDVIKVFRADQTYRFIFINRDTTAEEAVRKCCKEFVITDDSSNYSLCKVTVQGEKFVKQSKLPDKWSKLADIPLSARYYLKNNMDSEQLLPDENIPELLKEGNYTFLDLNSFEVALHLTQRDYMLFKRVEQTDFIDDLFHLQNEQLKNFSEFEDLVNQELFWVVTTMSSEPNLLRRAKMIKHFTKIAHHCKMLKNLNSTFAIISGLGYRAVSRMKATWEKAPAKSVRMFEELQSLMDPSRNMSKYRTLLNDQITQPPVIPYIPVVKKDLTFLHLGNDTHVNGLINFEKMRMIGREIRNICRLCNADPAQILSSAVAQHETDNKPTSTSIYQTLTRRGRRSSFNNARRMYEDAVNARKVKQFMEQLTIESDEDKLMELSKQAEPQPAPNSAQTRRRNTNVPDSPSKSSKNSDQKKTVHSRNNSEPQISAQSNVPTKKKMPISSLPKFGVTSPQAISKLMSLSEENSNKGSQRSPPQGRHHKNTGSLESLQSIAHENSNKNNNRNSLPSNHSTFATFAQTHHNVSPAATRKIHRKITRQNNCRSNSSSNFDVPKFSHKNGEQPVIMPNRSASIGSLTEPKMSSSNSSPSLAIKSHHNHNILPSVPNILRAPSMDSGVVGLTDTESHVEHPASTTGSHSSLSSGFASLTSLSSGYEQYPDHAGHYKPSPAVAGRSPVLHRHNYEVAHRRQKSLDHPKTSDKDSKPKRKSVEQTFLSGSRGYGDTPLNIYKDSYADRSPKSADNVQSYYDKLKGRPAPPQTLDFALKSPNKKGYPPWHHDKTPEDILEEKLIKDLKNQKIMKTPQDELRSNSYLHPSSPLCEKHSAIPGQHFTYDARLFNKANQRYTTQQQLPDKLPPPDRTSSPKQPTDSSVFVSDFANPDPKTAFVPTTNHSYNNKSFLYNNVPHQYHVCARHAHMYNNVKTNTSLDSYDLRKSTDNIQHSRSTSDISINHTNNKPIWPVYNNTHHSSFEQQQQRETKKSNPRRNSSGWSVTDLDNDKSQQAMQVWSHNSSSASNSSAHDLSDLSLKARNSPKLNNSYADTDIKDSPPMFFHNPRKISKTPPQHSFSQGNLSSSRLSLPSYTEATTDQKQHFSPAADAQEQLTSIV